MDTLHKWWTPRRQEGWECIEIHRTCSANRSTAPLFFFFLVADPLSTWGNSNRDWLDSSADTKPGSSVFCLKCLFFSVDFLQVSFTFSHNPLPANNLSLAFIFLCSVTFPSAALVLLANKMLTQTHKFKYQSFAWTARFSLELIWSLVTIMLFSSFLCYILAPQSSPGYWALISPSAAVILPRPLLFRQLINWTKQFLNFPGHRNWWLFRIIIWMGKLILNLV